MRSITTSLFISCVLLLSPTLLLANVPGGGTGTGANVTLVNSGSGNVTLGNGIVSIVCNTNGGTITTINYTFNNSGAPQTLNLLSGGHNGGLLYWENSNNQGLAFTGYTVVANPASNGGNYAEISMLTTSEANSVLEVHFSLKRGSTGFYVTAIWYHRGIDGAWGMGECRDNIYAGSIFNWMSVDSARNRLMQVSGGNAIGVNGAPAECSLWTNGIYAGQYEDKYKYSARLGEDHVWGWSSVGTGGKNVGLWNITASSEYYNGGPFKLELIEHLVTILNMLNGGHYGQGGDGNFTAGEIWTKVCGPYFIYCNNVTNTLTGTNAPAQALYADALAQGAAEAGAWPYAWFTNANYALAANRGTVTGKIVISDNGNPNASASNLWVGVVQQPVTSTSSYDFQQWAKPYQFWTQTDAGGNFAISNVVAGANYTLYAYGSGAPAMFMSQNQTGGNPPILYDLPASQFAITVTGAATNNLGNVTWTPGRVGATVFEIGYPSRISDKFRHGEDYWVGDIGPSKTAPSPVWSKWLEFPFDFPNGLNYQVGQSRWSTDWNFCQPVVRDSSGNYNNSSSTITFNLATAPTNGATASLYLGLTSDYYAAIIVTVNGNNLGSVGGVTGSPNNSIPTTGYYVGYGGSDTTIREGNQAMASDERLSFPASQLHAGQNTINIGIRQIGGSYFADHAMYDYIRLELTGYVPPPPGSVAAYAGNNRNLIVWPVVPGATSYNVLRSTTSGSGYVSVTNGVVGPVCGSGLNHATWLDTTAVNGTPYYYVVRSVNPGGSSTNSPESSATTPSGSLSGSAPSAPTGLTVGSVGHHSVSLNWTAPSGANFYTVYRSTLVDNGGGGSNVLNTIALANNVTNTTYTDNSPTDGSIYRYVVSATSAGGTSGNSTAAVAVPKPAAPAAAPTSLFITSVTNGTQDITLKWNPVDGAVGYAIYRATSAGGSYMFIQSVTMTTYTDYGLSASQTYYYHVVALNAGGTSTFASGLVNPNQAAPTNLVAVASTTDPQIVLTWNATPGATSYTLKRGTSAGNENVTVISGYTGTSYTNTSLATAATYYYVVTATGPGGTSGNSPEAAATLGSSVWVATASGNWGDSANWSGGQIPNGSSSIADFSTLSLPADITVTLDSSRTVSAIKFGDVTTTYNWSLAGSNTLTLASAAGISVVNQSVALSTPIAGTAGLTKTGLGKLVLGGATNTLTGGITNNAGTLTLDFSITNSPAADLIPSANKLTLGGGALQVIGNSSAVSSQTFNGLALSAGPSGIAAAPASGANIPALVLGSMPTTPSAGATIEFVGPATTNSSGTVNATATITTTTAGTGPGGAIAANGLGLNGYFATVGLYDWAATIGAGPYTVTGGSQVSGFYQTTGVTTGGNYDVNSGGVNSIGNAGGATSLRFNQNAAQTINSTAFTWQNCQGILVTPKCGAFNQTISGTSLQFRRATSSGQSYGVIWQNNTLGYLNCTVGLGDGRQAGQNNGLVQAGPGTVFYGDNSFTLGAYLNGGFSVISSYAGFGQTNNGYNTVSAVRLNGGTVVGNATFTNSQAGANVRPFTLGGNGGGLTATAGNTLTVDGVIGSAAGTGPLTIGIAASSANNNTRGLLPGSGSGTANTTPVYATGNVVLTNANYYTGGTVLQSGTLNINGINALGGANFGGLTFNGGTLQYAAGFSGNNGSADLTSIGTAGITLASGGGTIDLNGNAITYAGSIGNGGSGALVVKSSLPNGVLILLGANTYTGSTTISNATLLVSNVSGSATGAGNVTVQNNGTLTGNGTLEGSVTVASGGKLIPGGTFNALAIGNDLTLAAGSTTWMQIQHSPLSNNVVNLGGTLTKGGTLIVTNVSGAAFTAGDSFPLFTAGNYGGTFASLVLPTLTTGLVWNTNLLELSGTLTVVTKQPPAIGQVTIADGSVILAGSGGIPAWNYYVLATTNLAAPNWTPVATNQFDGDGNFYFTNTINPNAAQTFYKLQLQ